MKSVFEGAGGIRLIGTCLGSAESPPVILLHGGGQTRHAWASTQASLASRGFFAIAFDARGHGDSDWAPNGNYSFEAFAADLRAVARRINRPIACVGASLGGYAAALAIVSQPRVPCTALALVDVVPRLNQDGRARILAFMGANPGGFATADDAVEAVANYLPHRSRRKGTEGLKKNLRLRNNGRYYWHWDPAFIEMRQEDAAVAERLEQGLAAIETPILLIRGGLSDVVRKTEAIAFKKSVPRVEIVQVDGAAHMVAGDKNDLFTTTLVRFLERHR